MESNGFMIGPGVIKRFDQTKEPYLATRGAHVPDQVVKMGPRDAQHNPRPSSPNVAIRRHFQRAGF